MQNHGNLKAGFWIVFLFSIVLAARGLHAMVTGVYGTTPKLGPPILLYGTSATQAGVAYLCLAGIVLCGGLYALTPRKKLALAVGSAMLLAAGLLFATAHSFI